MYAQISQKDPHLLTDEDRQNWESAKTKAIESLTTYLVEQIQEGQRRRQYKAFYEEERPLLMRMHLGMAQAAKQSVIRDLKYDAAQSTGFAGFAVKRAGVAASRIVQEQEGVSRWECNFTVLIDFPSATHCRYLRLRRPIHLTINRDAFRST